MSVATAATNSASCAGLTRASILLRKNLSERMDCRVKPGNDGKTCFPDAVRHSSCRSAEPGSYQTPYSVTAPALQRTASRELRAALRPGNESLVLPFRLALVDEGADAFLGITGHHVVGHHLGGIAIGVGKAHLELAQKVAGKSAYTVKIGKAAFYRQLEMSLADAYRYAAEVMTENMMARDAEEGIGAFIDKRAPKWQDK